MGNALVRAETAIADARPAGFDFSRFRVFTSVPDHSEIGIVALHGMVVVYDERPLQTEGVVEGALYVRESQRPRSGLTWASWLMLEWNDREPRVGPAGSLTIRREVVQPLHWPYADDWSVRLSTGHMDGPYHNWAFGRDLIGKVVGVYAPATSTQEC